MKVQLIIVEGIYNLENSHRVFASGIEYLPQSSSDFWGLYALLKCRQDEVNDFSIGTEILMFLTNRFPFRQKYSIEVENLG